MISEKAKKLGEALVAIKVLTSEQLQQATEAASKDDAPSLISVLLESGFLTYKVFEKFVSTSLGIQSTVITNQPLVTEAVALIGAQYITTYFVYPFAMKEDKGKKTIALAMVDPTDEEVISLLQQKTGCRIIPVLVSLPDFKAAMKKNFHLDTIKVDGATKEEFLIVHTGDHERPTSENSKNATGPVETKTGFIMTKTVQPKPGWDQKTILGKFAPKETSNDFIGKNNKKFREEILAKLDLDPVDAQNLKEEWYNREKLMEELKIVAAPKLQKIYNTVSGGIKVEAMINALIKNGVLTKQDILVSTAVSLAFNEEKK